MSLYLQEVIISRIVPYLVHTSSFLLLFIFLLQTWATKSNTTLAEHYRDANLSKKGIYIEGNVVFGLWPDTIVVLIMSVLYIYHQPGFN